MHTAIFDAVNSIDQTHVPYHVQVAVDPSASKEAAAAQAAHQILSTLFPARKDIYDAALVASLAAVADGPGKTAGIALGTGVANSILELRSNDGATNTVTYVPGGNPGDWALTPPGFGPPAAPHWGNVTPWTMSSGSQFRTPNAPPDLGSVEYAEYFNEVKAIGGADSTTRTADQSHIAQFWDGGLGSHTPLGHWFKIAHTVSEQEGLTLSENARLFALLGLSQADGLIMVWDTKYHYDHWRPVTAIRAADTDGNPDTEPDSEWASFIVTPSHPSYSSGHSGVSGAAAAILAGFFGTDDISFISTLEGYDVPNRSFTSFSQAATEAANSRLYGGIHWRYDNEEALAQGFQLGQYIASTQLLVVPEPASGLFGLLALAGLPPVVRRKGIRNRMALELCLTRSLLK